MQKKILFISYDGMTDPLGQSQVIPYLQGLSKKGFQFFLLSCEKPEAFEKNKETVKKLLEGHSIEWHPIPYTKKPPVLSTLKDILHLHKKATQIHRQHSIDMVHTRPGIPALVGLAMKKKFGIKFLHDIREFYADSRVEGGIWNIKNPLFRVIYNYFKRKEKEEIGLCDGIVCLTHVAAKITRALPEYKKEIPLQVIPCSADLELFDPAAVDQQERQQVKKELGIQEGDIIINYLGSVGGWYMTNEIMRFCKLLADKKPGTKFLFISPHLHDVIAAEAFRVVTVGNLKEQKNHRFLLEAFKSLKNENIELDIYGKGPLQEELQQTINDNDLKVTLKGQVTNIQEQIGKYDLFIMSSLYEGFALSVLEAMALGIPTLLTDIPSFKEQCDDTAAYYKLNCKNDFIMQLLSLKNNQQQLTFLGRNCRKRALDNFTLQKHMAGLKAIYSNTLAEIQPAAKLSFAK